MGKRKQADSYVISTLTVILFLSVFIAIRSRSWDHRQPQRLLIVSVRGDVHNPGIYLLRESSVPAAVAAAGGALCGCYARGEKLELTSGDTLIVDCGLDRVSLKKASSRLLLILGKKLDINEASLNELMLVPGMNRTRALAVIRRRSLSPFKTLSELTHLSGIGDKTVEKWRSYLTVKQEGYPLDSSISPHMYNRERR